MSIRDHVREHSGFLAELRRYPQRGWIAGVCAGLADYFDWNVKLIRVLFALGFLFTGFFPVGVVYLLLWYLMDAADGSPRSRGRSHDSDRDDRYESPRDYSSGGNGSRSDVRARFSRMEERLRNMEECVSSKEFELRRELRKLESSSHP